MQTEKRILIAFILNLLFSIFECIGGILTGSIAILSDAIHDLFDAISIGAAYLLERKSRNGDARYSIFSSILMSSLLLFSSCLVIVNAISRILHPVSIHYDGMLLFAVVGICVNLCAAYFTHGGHSLNQKAVNLHMLEDVLGWAAVLVGAIIMRFTDFVIIDPLLSIGISIFILTHAVPNLKEAIHFLRHGNSTEEHPHTCGHHHHHHHH